MKITMELAQLKELLKLAQQYPKANIDIILLKFLEHIN